MSRSGCDDVGLEPLLDELERIQVVQSMEKSRRGPVAHIKVGVVVEPEVVLTTRIASVLGHFPFSVERVRPNVIYPD